ncbi:MAG: sigma-54-dependent Fis family transcriptional regulator [Candidatus Omnitrophica bacterium]|nr:sigma-54-dependent Fis family transcriptional regulator [Candidatus Omnitrophota bacterium]
MSERILVIDDEGKMRRVLEMSLSEKGYNIYLAESGEEGIKVLQEKDVDLVITDMKMPGIDGLKVLERAKELDPDCPVILMTAYGTVETAVKAMKEGAYDYILKPFELEEMNILVEKALRLTRVIRENRVLKEELKGRYEFQNIVGRSRLMQDVFKFINQVASTTSTVFIYGETGTGKELVARAIHYQSPRREEPFVPVNCAAIPETLLESELFGYVKGAFTGAHTNKIGRFETAHRGTIFLDEVGDMPVSLQAKILRVLQEKSFEKVGGTESIKVDVRIIAATNTDLKTALNKGTFREDLYYRLNVFPVYLPPLRERKEDISLLAHYFLKRYNKAFGKDIKEISPEFIELLLEHHWPGNVRELENIMERAIVLAPGSILKPAALYFYVKKGDKAGLWKGMNYSAAKERVLDSFEKDYLAHLLKTAHGNISEASRIAQIDRKNLYQKLKERNIDPSEFK